MLSPAPTATYLKDTVRRCGAKYANAFSKFWTASVVICFLKSTRIAFATVLVQKFQLLFETFLPFSILLMFLYSLLQCPSFNVFKKTSLQRNTVRNQSKNQSTNRIRNWFHKHKNQYSIETNQLTYRIVHFTTKKNQSEQISRPVKEFTSQHKS